jgi:hypothetical protein
MSDVEGAVYHYLSQPSRLLFFAVKVNAMPREKAVKDE